VQPAKTPYDATIRELQDAATAAGLNYEIWWVLKSDESRPKYVNVLNRYHGFFSAAINAHFVAMLMALYRIYETRDDTHNFPSLLERLEVDRAVGEDLIRSLRLQHKTLKPLWVKVSILRNDVFAHRSVTLDTNAAFAKAGATGNELKELVEKTKAMLNELTGSLRDSMHAFNLTATRDTIRMLEDLKNKRASGPAS
jgi:hypothetical protein